MRLLVPLLVVLLAAGAWWILRDPRVAPRAKPAVTAAEEPESPPPQSDGKPPPTRRLVGRVTGDAPLGGVTVRAEWEGGAGEGRTRDDGTYEIGDPGAGTLDLRAEAPDSRLGRATAWAGPDVAETKVGDIALRAAAGVTFLTVPATQGARLEIGGNVAFVGPVTRVTTGADGTAALRLPMGEHYLRALAEGFGRVSTTFMVASESQRVVVDLSPERQLLVTVRDKARQVPVEGARITAHDTYGPYGWPDAVTDAKGVAQVRGLREGDRVGLRVVPPGEVPQEAEGVSFRHEHVVPEGATEMTIEIDLPRTIEWEVLDGDIPTPPDGTVIPLRKPPGATLTPPKSGVMRGGRLVADGWPGGVHVGGEAMGPKGTLARLYCAPDTTVGAPTKFEMSATLRVTLLNGDGTPAAGTNVALVNGGNNTVCRAAAGEDGVARMERLPAWPAALFVVGQNDWDRKEAIGTVDLRKGDVAVSHTLTPERRYEVTLLLDGKPCLPDGCLVQVNGAFPFTATQDPEKGCVSGTFVPRSPQTSISLSAPGYRRLTATVDVPPGDEPLRHTFELDRGHECRVRIVGEQPKGIRLEFQQEAPAGWWTIDSQNMSPRAWQRKTEDGWVFTGLDAGRYRMRTMREGILYGPVEVGGVREAILVLDFTRWAVIRGRVDVPDGYGFKEVQLKLRGDGIAGEESQFQPGFGVGFEDGSFEVQIPGDRPVRLAARHPMLTCADAVETTTGRDGVVLRLVEGPTLAFRLPGWEAKYAPFIKNYPDWQRPAVRVRLLREGAAPVELLAIAKDGVWRAGGFDPGRYDVWIDAPEAMPQLLGDRELKAGANDLGEIPGLPGSQVRVRVLVRDGFAAPAITIWAQHLGEPDYQRHLQTGDGQAEVALGGLGPGRFRVTSSAVMGVGGRGILEEVDLDGANEVQFTLDLR